MSHGVWHRAWLTHFRLKGIRARILHEWPWYSRGLIPSFCLPLLLISLKGAPIENDLLARGTLTKAHRCRGPDHKPASPLGPEAGKPKEVPARGGVCWGLCSVCRRQLFTVCSQGLFLLCAWERTSGQSPGSVLLPLRKRAFGGISVHLSLNPTSLETLYPGCFGFCCC